MSATSPDVRRGLPTGEALQQNIRSRRRTGTIWRRLFLASLVIALLALGALLYKVIDDAFGYVALEYRTPPAEILGGRELEAGDGSRADRDPRAKSIGRPLPQLEPRAAL